MVKANREKILRYLLDKCDRNPGVFFDSLCYDFEISRALAKKIINEFNANFDIKTLFIIQRKVKIVTGTKRKPTDDDIYEKLLETAIEKNKQLQSLNQELLEAYEKYAEVSAIAAKIPICNDCIEDL